MGIFSKIFGNEPQNFDDVKVDREVIDSVIYYSKEAYPREFLSLLDGKIVDKTLYITGLIFLPGETCDTGAVLNDYMIPPTLKYWGSVHCHPGPSARPSDADLSTFSKHGVFHMILCLPYSQETFIGYDKYGNILDFEIGDYSYLKEDDLEDLFDEDILDNGEDLKPGFFDNEEEFNREFNENRSKNNQYPQNTNINHQINLNEVKINGVKVTDQPHVTENIEINGVKVNPDKKILPSGSRVVINQDDLKNKKPANFKKDNKNHSSIKINLTLDKNGNLKVRDIKKEK